MQRDFKILHLTALGLLLLLPCSGCIGAELGQSAPPLNVAGWAKGPVPAVNAGKNQTRVFLFWETDCDSCRASLPPLIELQENLLSKGITFIGVCPETAEAVEKFLTNSETGPKINFPIACDPNRKTFDAYMVAYEQTTVPRAFVVNKKNEVVWYGHPLAGLEKVLREIVENKFDFELARKTIGADRLQTEYFGRAAKTPDDPEVKKLGRKILSDGASNPWLLNNFAWRIEQDSQLKNRDVELALAAAKQACDATEWKRATFVDTYASALFLNGNAEEAIKLEEKALALTTNQSVLRTRIEQTLQTFVSSRTNNAGR
jgi:alkyl hydroperoxide reductase subunit AhpC